MNKLPFGFDKPEDSAGFLLWQTTTIWQRKIKKAIEKYNISHPQFVIMANLMWFDAHGYEINQIKIAQQTKLDKMTVSKSLKKLVNMGLVNRIENENDTRAKNVSLTRAGKELLKVLVPIVEGVDAEFFGEYSGGKGVQFRRILSELIEESENF